MVPTEGTRFHSTPDCSTALGRLGEGLCHNHRPHSIQETRRYGLLDDRLPAIFVHFPPHPSFHLTSPRVAVIGWGRSIHLPLIRGVVIVWFSHHRLACTYMILRGAEEGSLAGQPGLFHIARDLTQAFKPQMSRRVLHVVRDRQWARSRPGKVYVRRITATRLVYQ